MAESTKDFRVERVIRDDFGKAIWVRMQCFKTILISGLPIRRVYHDVIFMPDGNGWVYIQKRISDNYIPHNRYLKMTKIAAAIFNDK